MRLRHLAPALAFALAACTVETSSLKPRTDAECSAKDPATKACGYKCVSLSDPATGCGSAGSCQPCPRGPNGEAAICDGGGACAFGPATSCAGGAQLCGGECANLQTSDRHCGACDHACATGATCSSGVCSADTIVQAAATSSPRDIDCHEYGYVTFLDAQAMAWIEDVSAAPTDFFAVLQYAGPYGVSPRLAAADGSSTPYIYYAGRGTSIDPVTMMAVGGVYEYDSWGGWIEFIETTATERFSGLALSDGWVYHANESTTESRVRWVERSPLSGPTRLFGDLDATGLTTDVGPIVAIATAYDGGTSSFHAFALAGKAVIHLEESPGQPHTPAYKDVWSLPAPADRIAATSVSTAGSSRIVLYLADSASGRVWRYPDGGAATLISGPSATAPGRLALVADAEGAYWTNASAHTVMEYRESDSAVFALAKSSTTTEPASLCLGPWSGYVAWSDAAANRIYAVRK
jgi:hypothetical protein